MDHVIPTRRPDLVLIKKTKKEFIVKWILTFSEKKNAKMQTILGP